MARDLSSRHIAAGIAQIEGYLLNHAERARGQEKAIRFAAQMDWLSADQRDEVVEHFGRWHAEVTRDTLHTIAERNREMQAQYVLQYTALRRRLVSICVGLALGGAALCAGTCALALMR